MCVTSPADCGCVNSRCIDRSGRVSKTDFNSGSYVQPSEGRCIWWRSYVSCDIQLGLYMRCNSARKLNYCSDMLILGKRLKRGIHSPLECMLAISNMNVRIWAAVGSNRLPIDGNCHIIGVEDVPTFNVLKTLSLNHIRFQSASCSLLISVRLSFVYTLVIFDARWV